MPLFKEGNFEKIVELVSKLEDPADKKKVTPAQLALAWVHAQVKSQDSAAAKGIAQVRMMAPHLLHVSQSSLATGYRKAFKPAGKPVQ